MIIFLWALLEYMLQVPVSHSQPSLCQVKTSLKSLPTINSIWNTPYMPHSAVLRVRESIALFSAFYLLISVWWFFTLDHDLSFILITLIVHALKSPENSDPRWGPVHGWGYVCFDCLCPLKPSSKVTFSHSVCLSPPSGSSSFCAPVTLSSNSQHIIRWVLYMSVLLRALVNSLMGRTSFQSSFYSQADT